MDDGLREVMSHLAEVLEEGVEELEEVMSPTARVEAQRRVAAAVKVLKGELLVLKE